MKTKYQTLNFTKMKRYEIHISVYCDNIMEKYHTQIHKLKLHILELLQNKPSRINRNKINLAKKELKEVISRKRPYATFNYVIKIDGKELWNGYRADFRKLIESRGVPSVGGYCFISYYVKTMEYVNDMLYYPIHRNNWFDWFEYYQQFIYWLICGRNCKIKYSELDIKGYDSYHKFLIDNHTTVASDNASFRILTNRRILGAIYIKLENMIKTEYKNELV